MSRHKEHEPICEPEDMGGDPYGIELTLRTPRRAGQAVAFICRRCAAVYVPGFERNHCPQEEDRETYD